jgi:hypothetical protein
MQKIAAWYSYAALQNQDSSMVQITKIEVCLFVCLFYHVPVPVLQSF